MVASLPTLRAWAHDRSQPVTVFDLETTTNVPYVDWMGITEVALLTILPDGEVRTECAFVNPERSIPPKVRELTGITNQDVRGQPNWAAWAQRFHDLAREHVMVGYNSSGFDCVVVQLQNARYGVEGTEFLYSLDAKALPGVAGTLTNAAATFGLTSDTAHRALADTWLTARLVEALAQKEGLAVLDRHLGAKPKMGGGAGYSPRAAREEELRAHLAEHGVLPDLDAVAAAHGIKRSTLEGDVIRLIEAGEMSWAVLELVAVQEFLAHRLPTAIESTWIGEAEGKLKPLMLFLEAEAPGGLDYTQLRIAVAKWREATGNGK